MRVKAKLATFFKRGYVSITLCSWNAAILFLSVLAPNRGIRNASWGNGDYMFVWHDVFSTANFPFVAAFKFHRPSLKL